MTAPQVERPEVPLVADERTVRAVVARPGPASDRRGAGLVPPWCRWVKGPQVGPICSSDEQPEGHTDEVDDADPAAMFAAYNDEVERCRAATAGVPLDRLAGEHSVRWIDLHMIEEYAHHDGHADLHRDRIDGTTGDWRVPCRSFEAHEKLGGSSVRQEAM